MAFTLRKKQKWREIGNSISAMVNRGHLSRDLKAGKGEHANGWWKSTADKEKCHWGQSTLG